MKTWAISDEAGPRISDGDQRKEYDCYNGKVKHFTTMYDHKNRKPQSES